jgi:exonuclease SbcC
MVGSRRQLLYLSLLFARQRLRVSSVKNFLKSAAHQHKDPQVRLGYIKELDAEPAQAQEILMELARSDEDHAVRIAAIGRLDELNVLRELLGADSESGTGAEQGDAISKAAETRLVGKLNEGTVSDVSVRVLLSTHATRLAVPTANQGSVLQHRELALAAIDDEHSLLLIVQQTRFHDTRLAAALRLKSHDTLRAALVAVRSKDKVVAKQLQQRLDAEAAAEADLIAKRHAVTTTLAGLQALNDGIWSPQHGGRLLAAKERWASFDEKDVAASASQFAAAVTQAQLRLDEYTESQRKPEEVLTKDAPEHEDAASVADKPSVSGTDASKEKEAAVEAAKVIDPALEPVLGKLKTCSIDNLSSGLDELQQQVAADTALSSSNNVAQVLAHGAAIAVLFDPPYEINKARPSALQARIKRVAALVDVNTLLPGIELSEHEYVQQLKLHLDALNDRIGKAKQESSDRIKATHRQFAALSGTIKEGKWGPANSMMRRLLKKVSAMEAAERAGLDDKLARAETQLAEMADWQDFAARPKLEVLCESMEALPSKELSPDALAKEVRDLQNTWKSLGVSRASNDLWGRFKTAGDTAYEPCKAWFDQKQKERQEKLDAKAALCKSLEQQQESLAENPDWKAIVRLVNNSKREWSKNRVADRKPDKALEQRFSDALKAYEEALSVQYVENSEAKQALVTKVAELAGGEITQHSANQAKSLLSAWKLVGIMRRKEDQALWEIFNGHLGTIFKHQHQVEREKQRAGLEHVFRAKDIVKRLKQLSKGDSLEESEVQGLSAEFNALAEFPERDKKFLLRDFRQAMDACSRVQESATRRRSDAEFEERRRLVGLCEQLEAATQQSGAQTSNLTEDISHAWETSDVRVVPEIAALLQKRRDAAFEHLSKGTHPDYAANESARRDLLIRMEIAAGLDTPTEDKPRRMQYQLQNLQAGMTSAGVNDSKLVLQQLEIEWIAAGPSSQAVSDSLHSRFLKAYRR